MLAAMRALPPLFSTLNDVDVYTALRQIEEREVAAGTAVITEGNPAEGLIVVASGELEIRSRGVVLGHARDGDLVGEMALFESGSRTATVHATKPTKIR